jgi:hypothetical protein
VTLGELVPAARKALANGAPGVGGAPGRPTPPLWDGQAGPRIADVVMRYLGG